MMTEQLQQMIFTAVCGSKTGVRIMVEHQVVLTDAILNFPDIARAIKKETKFSLTKLRLWALGENERWRLL